MKGPDTSSSATVAQRERTASRLLRSTAARSYDPELDIDWTASAEPGKGFMLEHRCSRFLDSNGLLGGPGIHLWRRSFLLG